MTTGAIRRAKLQSKCHHQQTNTQFLQAGCPSCRPTNSVKALNGEQLNSRSHSAFGALLPIPFSGLCCLNRPWNITLLDSTGGFHPQTPWSCLLTSDDLECDPSYSTRWAAHTRWQRNVTLLHVGCSCTYTAVPTICSVQNPSYTLWVSKHPWHTMWLVLC